MALTTDEEAMRTALQELAVGQPDAPLDRVASVRRRHLRRRRMQSAVAASAAVLVAAGVFVGTATGSHSGRAQPAHRTTPSWALPWKDNLSPELSSLRPAALAAWRASQGNADDPFYAPHQVIWYLTQPLDAGNDVMVVFEVERDDGEHRLVVGLHDGSTNENDAQNWRLYDVAAPDPHTAKPVVISIYDTAFVDGVAHNWVAVLTDPSARSVFLRERVTTQATLQDGFNSVELGPLRGQVSVAVETKDAKQIPVGVVGLPGAPDTQAPQLEPPAELVGVPGGPQIGAGTGQGGSADVNESTPKAVRTIVYARCYGGPSISISFDDDRSTLTIPCDNQQHVVNGPTLTHWQTVYGNGGHAVEIHGSKLTAFRYAVVIR
jgi:hypothetical protein